MNETEIVQMAQQGDTHAFRQLFEDNKRRVFTLAFQYTKNKEDAEDILQETFIKAFHSLDKFEAQDDTNFSSWLYRIGINTSIDHLRKNKMKKDNYIDSDQLPHISSNDGFSHPEHAVRIKEIVKEIADYMKCSEGSVKKQLFRAFKMIKKHFKNLFSEDNYEML